MPEVTPDGTIVLKMPHPATHPSRKVRTVGPLVDLWLDREPVDLNRPDHPALHARPIHAGPDRQDPMWTYVLGRVRPEVELTAWLLASRRQPHITPGGPA